MDVRSLAFRTDLALLRFGGSRIEDRGDHLVVSSPHNPTFWWGNFLLLDRVPDPAGSEAWLDRFGIAFPGANHVALGVDDPHAGAADLQRFVELGFDVDASAVMTAQSLTVPRRRNPRAEYRPLTSDDDWTQSVELTQRCHDREDDQAFVAAKARTNRGLVRDGHGTWFGAFLDGRLVAQLGLLAAGTGLARYQTVETDPEHRRTGLAGALVHLAGEYGLGALGAQTLVMVADPDYFAIDLYRAVGFTRTETQLQVQRAAGS